MRPMRRASREIRDREALEAIMAEGDFITIATHDAEGPYAVPLDYAYGDGVVWIHCAVEGRKLDALAADPRVGFVVVGRHEVVADGLPCTWTTHYASVIGTGSARIVREGDELREGLGVLVARHGGEPAQLPDDLGRVAVIRIDVEHMTGKASGSE